MVSIHRSSGRKTRPHVIVFLCAFLTLSLFDTKASALDINGAFIMQYVDREGGTSLTANEGNGGFRFTQAAIMLNHEFSPIMKTGATISASGSVTRISDAWLSFAGLPWEGDLTVGRFYKPLGGPLQTIGLSYPGLLFHTQSVTGARINMENSGFRWQAGINNVNPLSATGTAISGSSGFARPIPAVADFTNTSEKEFYGFLGWQGGGTWGSLDLNGMYTFGAMTRQDNNVLNTSLNAADSLRAKPNTSQREGYNIAADYTYGPFRINGEWARFEESKLEMIAYNISGAYRTGKLNWIIGYDKLKNNVNVRPLANPELWLRERVSYSVAYDFHPRLQFQLEYENNEEDMTTGIREIPNDAILFQVLGTF